MLSLRIKQCERAMRNGRLDEAYAIVRQPDVRSHRRGQELLESLVRALVDRGRKHLAAGRLSEAAADAEKAAGLAGSVEVVAQFQTAVEHALEQEQEANRQCGQALAIARRQMDRGELSVVQRMLETAAPPPDGRVDGLKRELHARRLEIESCQAKAAAAMEGGDLEAAIDHLTPLPRGAAQNGELRNLCGQISQGAAKRIHEAVQAGRLDTAAALLAKLRRLPIETTDTFEASSLLEQCRLAHDAIESGRWREAEESLGRLAPLMPEAKWVSQTAAQVRQLAEGLSLLRSGPLSLLGAVSTPLVPRENVMFDDFSLLVDGVGSFKVIARPVITLGPVSSSRKLDVPLAIDAGISPITISRSDDDYFLRGGDGVSVNGTATTSRLLANGDKIAIGPRSRIIFRKPSQASATAVLDLGDARPAAASLRNVVLMDREIVIGPGSADHIRALDLREPAILLRRGSGLAVRAGGQAIEVIPNTPIDIGNLHLVVRRDQGI